MLATVVAVSMLVSSSATAFSVPGAGLVRSAANGVAYVVGGVYGAGKTVCGAVWQRTYVNHPRLAVAAVTGAAVAYVYRTNEAFRARVQNLVGIKPEVKRSILKKKRSPEHFRKIANGTLDLE